MQWNALSFYVCLFFGWVESWRTQRGGSTASSAQTVRDAALCSAPNRPTITVLTGAASDRPTPLRAFSPQNPPKINSSPKIDHNHEETHQKLARLSGLMVAGSPPTLTPGSPPNVGALAKRQTSRRKPKPPWYALKGFEFREPCQRDKKCLASQSTWPMARLETDRHTANVAVCSNLVLRALRAHVRT